MPLTTRAAVGAAVAATWCLFSSGAATEKFQIEIPAINNAAYWSQRHRRENWPPASRATVLTRDGLVVPRVAVLVTGLLRVSSEHHLEALLNATAGCDIFVATYDRFEGLARRLSPARDPLLISDKELQAVMKQIKTLWARQGSEALTKPFPLPVWQWYQLSAALSRWKDDLLAPGAYHTVARLRTDLQLPPGLVLSQHLFGETVRVPTREVRGAVFAASDTFFYATPPLFLRIFASMFNESASVYMSRDPTKAEVEAHAMAVERLGSAAACLSGEDYAPLAARLEEVDHLLHAARLLPAAEARSMVDAQNEGLVVTQPLQLPGRRRLQVHVPPMPTSRKALRPENRPCGKMCRRAAAARRQSGTGETTGFAVFCGCKVSVGPGAPLRSEGPIPKGFQLPTPLRRRCPGPHLMPVTSAGPRWRPMLGSET